MKISSPLPRRSRRLAFVVALLTLLLTFCFSAKAFAVPSVSAKSAVLIEAESGRVLYQQNAFVRLPMASTTKIMTALVAIRSGDIDRVVSIPAEATGIEGSSIYLYPGERLTLRQLIYALLLESANDAATAIAMEVAGSVASFAALMNSTATELGLTATHFTNPHGLDDGEHYTTAYDLARIAAAALADPVFREICGTTRKTIPLKGEEGTRVLINHNKMLTRYEGAIGVKTGFTKKSGRCLVSAAERDGLTLIAVTLCAPDDWNDHAAMLDFGFEQYTRVRLTGEGEVYARIPVLGSLLSFVQVKAANEVYYPLGPGEELRKEVSLTQWIQAPVTRGQTAGTVTWYLGDQVVAMCPLVYGGSVGLNVVNGRSFVQRMLDLFGP